MIKILVHLSANITVDAKLRIYQNTLRNLKDKHSSVGLIKAVNKRKKLLDYLKKIRWKCIKK